MGITENWPSDPWLKTDIGKLLATLGKPGDPIPEPVRIDFDLMEVVPAPKTLFVADETECGTINEWPAWTSEQVAKWKAGEEFRKSKGLTGVSLIDNPATVEDWREFDAAIAAKTGDALKKWAAASLPLTVNSPLPPEEPVAVPVVVEG